MMVKTRIFELYDGNYKNLSELARTMEISVSQVYRVRQGRRQINQKFIVGAIKAFPDCKLDELFYLAPQSGNEQLLKEKQRMEGTQQALDKFTSAIDKYGEHLNSHISALISLSEAAQELRKGAEAANKVLSHLIEVSVN